MFTPLQDDGLGPYQWIIDECPCPFQRGMAILRAGYRYLEPPQRTTIRHALSDEFFIKVRLKIKQLDTTWHYTMYSAKSRPIPVDETNVIYHPDVLRMLHCYLRQPPPYKLYFTTLPVPRNRLDEILVALLLEVDDELEKSQ